MTSRKEPLIRAEILKAMEWLGASPDQLATFEGMPRMQLYDAAERLGADRYLLAYIGSWAEDDIDTLADLRHWNEEEQAEALKRVRDGHGALKPPADRIRR